MAHIYKTKAIGSQNPYLTAVNYLIMRQSVLYISAHNIPKNVHNSKVILQRGYYSVVSQDIMLLIIHRWKKLSS